jgi:UrcA family protein
VLAQPTAAQPHRLREVLSRDPTRVVRATTIDYSDIDTGSIDGLQTLLSRIKDAADAVCGPVRFVESDAEREDYRQCRDTAIARAVAAARLPRLTALAASRPAALAAAK